VKYTVKNDTPNRGREYYKCSSKSSQCYRATFKWADEEKSTISSTVISSLIPMPQYRKEPLFPESINIKRGINLSVADYNYIQRQVDFKKEEKIHLVYLHHGFNFGSISRNDIFVVITSKRIFKYEKGIEQVFLYDIVDVEHQKNNIFSWDKIVVLLRDGKKETFGIYSSDICGYFCWYLKDLILSMQA